MNSFLLMEAVKRLLEKDIAQLPLNRNAKGANQCGAVPAVYLGSLPATTTGQTIEAPFILIQALNGFQDEDNFAYVALAARICVWSEDPETRENDLHNLLELCSRSFLRQRARALEGKYILAPADRDKWLSWTRPDEQALQYSEAYLLSTWKMQGIE